MDHRDCQDVVDRAIQKQAKRDAALRWPKPPSPKEVAEAEAKLRAKAAAAARPLPTLAYPAGYEDVVERLEKVTEDLHAALEVSPEITPEIFRMQQERARLQRRVLDLRGRATLVEPSEAVSELSEIMSAVSVSDVPATVNEEWTVEQFQNRYLELDAIINTISEYLWTRLADPTGPRSQQVFDEARNNGIASTLASWFKRYPDLSNLLCYDSDDDIIRGIIWRFLREEILDDVPKYNSVHPVRPGMDAAWSIANKLADILKVLTRPDDDLDLVKFVRQAIVRPAITLQQAMCASRDMYYLEFFHFVDAPRVYSQDVEELIATQHHYGTRDVANNFITTSLCGKSQLDMKLCLEPLCCTTPALMHVPAGFDQRGEKVIQPAVRGTLYLMWGTKERRQELKTEQRGGQQQFLSLLLSAHNQYAERRW